VFESHDGKALDGGLGHIQLDPSFECGDGSDRDRHIPATPQVPLLKEDMGHMMRPTFDDEPFDDSDFSIDGVNAIASMNPHLAQGEGVMGDGLRHILSGHGC